MTTPVLIAALLLPGLFSLGVFGLTAFFVRSYLGETPRGLRNDFDKITDEVAAAFQQQRSEWNALLEELADERERISTERKRLSMQHANQKKRDANRENEDDGREPSLADLSRKARELGLLRH